MKIYIMTDMEGVCGVLNADDWIVPGGRYYEDGKRLLTLEVNAAVEGFLAAGATEVYVADGHGYGGINQALLNNRTYLISRGARAEFYPFSLDGSFDAIAWVGQHAKAGTAYAHLPHTQSFRVRDWRINGISVGEFGQMAMCAAWLGVRSIFCSGDEAMTMEARELAGGIETVSVKKGVTAGSGDGDDAETYKDRNAAAIHMHPERARELIREGAERALGRFARNREEFHLIELSPPFSRHVTTRAGGDIPADESFSEHPDDFIRMMNM